MMPCKLIDADDVRRLLSMKDTIEACEAAFADWGRGEVVCPPKVTLELGEDADWPKYDHCVNMMPAYIHGKKSAGIKCVGGSLNNPSWGLPYIIALISLFDPETGVFRCIMDGVQITNYRTGAQAAVAAKYICDKKRVTLGIFGAGAQGRTQLLAFSEVFDIEHTLIYDIKPGATEAFIGEMSGTVNCPIEAADQREVASCDIVVSVTHARDKFIKKEWIRPGQIVFPMGSYTECDDELILSADRVIVDSVDQTLHRGALKGLADDGRFGEKDIYATIGEIVCGKKSGKMTEDEIIVCIPIGTGAMDVAVATSVYEKALAEGIGVPFVFNSDLEVACNKK